MQSEIRRVSRVVRIGNVLVGGKEPIRFQSMLTSDTCDLPKVIEEVEGLFQAGCEIIRVTVPNHKSVEALPKIRKLMVNQGINTPLVADIHFNPQLAINAAEFVEKVRINPGNYADKKRFEIREYSEAQYQEELQRLEEKLLPLIKQLQKYDRSLRIGTNHGSLSDRVMNRFGDTPEGMAESAMEFLRILEKHQYFETVISMKASNPIVMRAAYQEIVRKMDLEGMNYPLHLGVTEAGNGIDGRVKSALGIGSLLLDGIGDTIRVSLTEPATNEIPAARSILNGIKRFPRKTVLIQIKKQSNNISNEIEIDGIKLGGESPFRLMGIADFVLEDFPSEPFDKVWNQKEWESEIFPNLHSFDSRNPITGNKVILVESDELDIDRIHKYIKISDTNGFEPVFLVKLSLTKDEDELMGLAANLGVLILENVVQGLIVPTTNPNDPMLEMILSLLQAARVKTYKADFISCPSCGRTHFDLQAATAKIKMKTEHLKGVKIGIMGCVVNGPGEMADADFGYVGSGFGKISLYKGQNCVRKNIPEEKAVDYLVELIQEHGMWQNHTETT
ncbi:MAG: 4-hydroxy-3-methylbut-2-en-1-yl diphosphate synthase [Deltaproteobacteria bacterium]|nr:4-hydroxy-3-methylbut-2-en-1-yl diphosphate synthase [Deltaproteobacteria bacterium]